MNASTRNMHPSSRTTSRRLIRQPSPRLRYKHLAFGVGLALGSLLFCGVADAAPGVTPTTSPTGGKVVGGIGSITQRGAETIIHQKSKLLSLDWKTFNVGEDASVLFKQPSFRAVALNRILDQNPSQIFGKISSNGQIFLINTHGIIFGASAQLNVGGLVASTLDLTPTDFLKQHFSLDAHGGRAGIVNRGTIAAASGGSISLIGGHVVNDGLIVANYGHINLDGADKAMLSFDDAGLINVEITGKLKQRFAADQGAVVNEGTLRARSGTVVLKASAAKNLFTNLVNNSGVIEARGISTDGGVVRLVGSGGNVVDSGNIDASGVHGGNVQLLSDRNVGVSGSVNASGSEGGGSIRVGGGWQGGEGLQTASATYVGPDARLDADATRSGDGGSVVVWGNDVNNFYGSISARGGALGGDGGRAETSSHYGLNVQGQVDMAAPHGQAGMWLLDPYNLEITTGTSGTANVGSSFIANANNATVSAATIGAALDGNASVFIFTGTSGSQSGDITVSAPITAGGEGLLYLKAAGSIFINSSISAASGSPLNVYLWANYGGSAPTGTSYTSNDDCTACNVIVGSAADATIQTHGGDVHVRTGDATYAGGVLRLGSGGSVFGKVDTSGGMLDVRTTGISQQGTGSTISAGAADLDAGSGAINLANSGNVFTGTIHLTGTDVSLTNNAATELGASTVAGTLDVNSHGALTQTGALNVTGDATFTQNSTTAGASQDVELGSQTNDFQSNVTIAAGTGAGVNNLSLKNTAAAPAMLTLPASVDGDVTLDYTNAALTLSALNAGGALTASAAGGITLDGNITTTDAQTYNSAVTLNSNTGSVALTGNGVRFVDTVDNSPGASTAQSLSVDQGSGQARFEGEVGGIHGALGALTVNGTGQVQFYDSVQAASLATMASTLLYGNVTTQGAQAYGGVLYLATPVTLTSNGGDVTIDGAVENFVPGTSEALTISTGAGDLSFGDVVGGAAGALGALALDGSGATTFADTVQAASLVTGTGPVELGGNVTTTGAQTYNGAVTLDSDVVLTTTDSDVDFAGTVGNATSGASRALTISTGTGDVSFGDAVGGTGGALGALALDGSGATTFADTVQAASLVTGTGPVDLGGNVTTTGAQTYNGAVTLNSNTGSVALTGNGVRFVDTVDNSPSASTAQTLSVNQGSGQARFEDEVGGIHGALGALTVNGTGQVQFYDSVQAASLATLSSTLLYGNVTTQGAQAYGGVLYLATPVTLTSNGGDVTIDGAVENFVPGTSEALTISTGTGDVSFGDVVGGAGGALAALALDGSGATTFADTVQAASLVTGTGPVELGGSVTTTGAQTYNGTVTLNVPGDATLTGTTVTLNGVTGNGNNLTVAGNAALNGTLAGVNDLAVTGATMFGTANVATSGAQTYSGAVTLAGDTTLDTTTGNGAVTFVGTVDNAGPAAQTLTVNSGTGAVAFDGTVGGGTYGALDGLTIDGGQLVAHALHIGNGGLSVTTTMADITQGGAFEVGGASSFDAGAYAIMLDNTGNNFTGPVSLVNTGNNAVYLDNGGHALTLGSLSLGNGALTLTDYGSTPLLLTNAITTDGGDVNFGGAIIVDGPSVSIDTTGGGSTGADIGFGGDINGSSAGSNSLSLDAGSTGVVSFGGNVGSAVALNDLTVNAQALTVPSVLSVAGDLEITSVDALTTGASWSGANVMLETTGTDSDLTLGGNVVATDSNGEVILTSNGDIIQSVGTVAANTLTGNSAGTTILNGNNAIANLGSFTANGFILNNGQALAVTGVINGGTSPVSLATSSGALAVNAAVNGSAVTLDGNGGLAINAVVDSGNGTTHLSSGGTITENGGAIVADTLTGNSTNATALTGNNAITHLGAFSANGFSLANAQALEVAGPVSGGAGSTSLTITNGVLTINDTVDGGAVSLDGDGGVAINAAVNSTGNVALTSGGAIAENGSGAIHAAMLTGSSIGATHLDGANTIDSLGNFSANGFSLTATALTVDGTVDGGTAGTALTTTAGDLTINGTVGNTGGATALNSAGAIAQDANGIVKANTLTGSSVGATALTGSNQVDNLGDFTATGFSFTNAKALTVAAGGIVDGGANGTTLTTTAGDLSINGMVGNTAGTTALIASAGAIGEGASGIVKASTLTGGSQGDTSLVGNNQIDKLATFSAANLALVDARDLSVVGSVSTTNGTGDISFTTTTGNKLNVGLVLTGGAITLDSGSDLNVTNDIQGSAVNLAATGNLAIGAIVDSGTGATTLTQQGTGTISEGPAGSIVAGTLTGSAVGSTTLDGNNAIDSLGNFTADGFALTNGQAFTLAAGAAVDGGSVATLTTTGTGSDLTIDGLLRGTSTGLISSGAINEGASGVVQADTLTGSSAGATALVGTNAIDNLGNFTAAGFALTNGQALTVTTGAMLDGGAHTTLTTTGAHSDLVINGTVKGVDTSLVSSSGIGEGAHGVVQADTLTGSSIAATSLTGANAVANLGSFSANGFALNNDQALTIADGASVNGGHDIRLSTTGSGSDLTIKGSVTGMTANLVSAGAIHESAGGSVHAGTLTGSAVHGAHLIGTNAIDTLGDFTAADLALSNGQSLTIAAGSTVDGGVSTTLETTGANSNLTLNGVLKGATTTLLVSGAIKEAKNGVLDAGTLTGTSVGSTMLTGDNDVARLGNFTASDFALSTDSGLTVAVGSTVNGGGSTELITTGSGNDLVIDGIVQGHTVKLVSSGAIGEGSAGRIGAGTLTGGSSGDTALMAANRIDALGAFNARNFKLTNARALVVGGPLTTIHGSGDVMLSTVGGTGNTLTVNQAIHGGAIALTSAGDLTVANAVTGTRVDLASNGNLAVNAKVDSGAGITTLTQKGAGGISGGANGGITAGTLTGSAAGVTTLGSSAQFMDNHVDVLGGFSSPAGFSFTNGQTLTLASVNGSAFTVDAGQSDLYLAVRNGDLLQNGTDWLYDGTGTWSATGHIGLATAPIYVTGVSNQTVASIGLPPAYFYAVDTNGNLLRLTGGSSVNIPTSTLSSRSQNIIGHTDNYIDISVVTAVYRSYGVVPPGVRLPSDRLLCALNRPSSEDCPENY